MKAKFFALVALVLGLAACQNEPEGLDVNVGGEQAVTINVTVPETETRAGGLNSALGVFDNGVLSGDATMRYILQIYYGDKKSEERLVAYSDGKSVAFDVRLVPERTYQFVVWADVVDTAEDVDKHYNTADLTNVTLNNTWIAMDETRDAFTTTEEILFNGNTNLTLNLTRPFAKLRVVTTDMEALNNIDIEPKTATVEYTTAHRASFNAVEGTFAEASMDKTHNFEIASYGETGNADRTLFTDYFFADNETVNFILTVNDQNGQPIVSENFNTDIYVKRNHLTTIKGGVLTDSKNFTITVEDSFATPEIEYTIWDGKTLKEPTLNDTTGNYEISQGSQLAWLAAAVSGTLDTRAVAADSFAGKTFALTQDIDLGDHEWKPIGMGGKHFEGTFDGQGHTIKGLRVTKRYSGSQAALFCSVAGTATIKNLIIDGAYVKYPADGKDYYGAALVGTAYGHVTIENVTVQNSHITGNNKVAAIIAHDGSSNSLNIDGCVVDNCYIATEDAADGGNVGGVMGLFQTGGSNNVIKNTVVKNCKIVAINSANAGKRANSQFVGGTISKANQTLVIENCSVENNTYTETFVHAEGVADYVGGYDNKFVGGDRDDKYLGIVIINGTRYEGTEEPKNVSAEDGKFYATIDEAVKAGNEEITLGQDTYDATKVTAISGKTISFVGNGEETIFDYSSQGYNSYVNGGDGNFTFENMTITRSTETFAGMAHTKSTVYKNCIINGVYFVYEKDAKFINCTFNITGNNYNCWLYGTEKATYTNCTFNCDGKSIYVDGNGETGSDAEFNNCIFNDINKVVTDKAAVETGTTYGKRYTLIFNDAKVNGFNINPTGTNTGTTLWANKHEMGADKLTVIVDGVQWVTDGVNYNVADGTYLISKAAGLTWFSDQMNNKKNTFAGKTIKIVNDIDMAGVTYYGGSIASYPSYCFKGTFDGGEKVISNLTITVEGDSYGAAALIPTLAGDGTTIKDVTLKNVNISSSHYAAGIWGYTTSENCWISVTNCHVEGGTITGNIYNNDNGDKIGGIGGIFYTGTVSGCSVKGVTISGYRDTAGIVGWAADSKATIKNNTLEDVTINVNNATNYKKYTKRAEYDVNSYVGEGVGTAKLEGNTGDATINWGDIAE